MQVTIQCVNEPKPVQFDSFEDIMNHLLTGRSNDYAGTVRFFIADKVSEIAVWDSDHMDKITVRY